MSATAAAVKEAGLQGKVAVVTHGGGSRQAGCDNIANGNFTSYVKWDVRGPGARSQRRDQDAAADQAEAGLEPVCALHASGNSHQG